MRLYIFIKSWLYYPKLIRYLQKTQPYMANCMKKLGRIKYAKFISCPQKNKDYADGISDFISEWVSNYDKEPIEK